MMTTTTTHREWGSHLVEISDMWICLKNKYEIRVQSLEYDLKTTILNILGNKTCYFITNMKL